LTGIAFGLNSAKTKCYDAEIKNDGDDGFYFGAISFSGMYYRTVCLWTSGEKGGSCEKSSTANI